MGGGQAGSREKPKLVLPPYTSLQFKAWIYLVSFTGLCERDEKSNQNRSANPCTVGLVKEAKKMLTWVESQHLRFPKEK